MEMKSWPAQVDVVQVEAVHNEGCEWKEMQAGASARGNDVSSR